MHRLASPSARRYSVGTLSLVCGGAHGPVRRIHQRVPAWRLFGLALVLLALAEVHL